MARFVKGQTGNPTGRPREMLDLKRECRDALPEIIEALKAALKLASERVQAANTLLAYGFGKPVARVDHRIIRSAADLSDDELQALIASDAADNEQELMH